MTLSKDKKKKGGGRGDIKIEKGGVSINGNAESMKY